MTTDIDMKKLDDQITSLEAGIARKTAGLKVAQDRWDDWHAGNLRAAIGRDRLLLRNLKVERAKLEPMEEKRSSAIFISSNH